MKIKEITIKEAAPGAATYKVVKSGPQGTDLQSADMHTTLHLDPEASKGIVQNPSNPNQYTMNAPANSAEPGAMSGPKQGAEVEMPANEEQGDAPQRKPRYQWQSAQPGGDFKAHYDAQKAAQYKHAGVHPSQFDDVLDIENPFFDVSDENSDEPEEIEVGVDYDYTQEPYTPARIRYDDYDHPEEGGEIEINVKRVVDLDNGEDVTDKIDMDALYAMLEKKIQAQGPDDSFEETIGGDPTDNYVDDIIDKDFEKHAKGYDRPEMKEHAQLDSMLRIAGLK